MEAGERNPFLFFDQKSDEEVVITLWAKGLQPFNSRAERHDYKNGFADVTFNNNGQGMDAKIEVQETKTERTVWRSIVRKFPSQIERSKCHWRVEKDKVVITLIKKKEKGGNNYVDWKPLFDKNGLDQYREIEDVTKATGAIFLEDGLPVTNITILDIDRSKFTYERVVCKPP